MTEHFTIDMLPANDGDALWVEWGDEAATFRMLIDGGRGGQKLNDTLAVAFAARLAPAHKLNLLVNTHMDADHIAGVIGLLQDAPVSFATEEIWFNAFRHLPPIDVLGWKQSDQLEVLVEAYVRAHPGTRWNDHFGEGEAIVLPDPPEDENERGPVPPAIDIGGMNITLLSPTLDRLHKVAAKWPAAVRRARLGLPPEGTIPDDALDDPHDDTLGFAEDKGVDPAVLVTRDYKKDSSVANGASIAFLAEFAGKRVLFAADAHAEVLEDTLRRLQPHGPVMIDAVKLAHHASEKNLSPTLLGMISCPTWLISTNGNLHNHPDRRAIARLITRNTPTHLVFNYRCDETKEWGKSSVTSTFGFTSYLPAENIPGTRFDVITGESEPLPPPLP